MSETTPDPTVPDPTVPDPTSPDAAAPAPAQPITPDAPPATWEQPWTASAATADPTTTPPAQDPAPPAPAAPAVSSSPSLPAVGSVVAYNAVDPLTGDALTGVGFVLDAYAGGEGADEQRRVILAALPASLNLSADDVTPVSG